MRYALTAAKQEARAALIGQLTYSDAAIFAEMVSRLVKTPATAQVIDLNALEFMDSAGLGMLLVANDAVRKAGGALRLSHPRGQVAGLLQRTCVDKLVPVELA